MGKITNKYNYPEPIVRAITNDPYKGGGDISVTRLISPVQQVALQKIHADEIEEDVSDRIWSLLGQAVHHIAERSARGEDLVEMRVEAEVLDWKVSGQFDLLADFKTLYDYKVTSVWSVKEAIANGKDEWEEQLNLLAQLIKIGHTRIVSQGMSWEIPVPEELKIVAICRDWRKNEAMRYDDYPKQCEIIEIDLWDEGLRQDFLETRVAEHQQAQAGETIPCTKKEKWTKPDTWAVMKKGRNSALRVFDSHEEADDFMVNQDLPPNHYIEHRPGQDIRCEQYCSVRDFCPQYQSSTQPKEK